MNPEVPRTHKWFLPIFLLCFMGLAAQVSIRERSRTAAVPTFQDPPRLVVGIMVDQMRFDYLTRFWNEYGEGGFRRLVGDGFNCRDHRFGYAPTSSDLIR